MPCEDSDERMSIPGTDTLTDAEVTFPWITGSVNGGSREGSKEELHCRKNKELDNLSAQNRYVSSFSQTTIYIGLGETDLAFKWLERAYEERLWYLGLLAVDPLFDGLRPDPRYTDLIRRMNLTTAVRK